MKRILFLFSFFYAFQFQAQEADWYRVNPPSEALSSSNYKYQVDDQGFVYCIFAFGDTLRVSQYQPLTASWNIISNETLTATPDKIKVDKAGGIIFFTFVSEQFPNPLFNLYTIENQTVNLKFRKINSNYEQYTPYDFRAAGLDQYYWFTAHTNGTDWCVNSWNFSTAGIDTYIVPQFNGKYLMNLQMEQAGDTLWLAAGENPLNELRVVKTHKSAINFVTIDGSAEGIFLTGGGNYLKADRTTLLSNRFEKVTIASVESNNNKVEFTFTNGELNPATPVGLHYPNPMMVAKASDMDHGIMLGNFSPYADSSALRVMVLSKNYNFDQWDTVGSPSTQFLRFNNTYVANTSLGYAPLSRRFVAAFDSVSYSKQLRVLNALPDPDSTLTITHNTLCTNPGISPNYLFSEFSLWDPNHDMLEIVGVNSSDASVISAANVIYSTGYFVGERVAFDVNYQNASLGTTTLDFFITDGYDTIMVSHNVTFANYTLNFTTDGTHCGPGQPTLSADLNNGYIDWYDSPTGGTYLGSGASFTTPHITSTTVYYAEGLDNNCVTPRMSASGVIFNIPTVNAGTDQTLCDGASITLAATGSGGAIYTWDNGVTDGVSFVPPLGWTPYTVTATDTNGCTNTDQVEITVNNLPAVDAGFDQTICSGDNVILHADGAFTYTWDNGVSDSIPFNPTITKTYHVTGTDVNGCMNMDSVVVTVNSLPVVNGGSDQSVCDGGFITLSGSGADSYSWDHGVSDGFSFMPPATDLYVVTGYDLNGCSANDTVLVTVNTLPAVDAGTDQSVCENTSITLTGSGAGSYSWDNGVSNGVSFTQSPGTMTYTVTGTDANGCQNTDMVDVTVNGLPSVFAGVDQSICVGDNVILYGDGANTYSWDNGVSDSIPFNPTITKTYHVTGTDANGCMNMDSVLVTVNSLPVVNGGSDQSVCDGGFITLSGSGADSYSWDHGVSDGFSFMPPATDLYVVTGYDLNGCSANDTVLVTVFTLPAVDAGTDQTVCENTSITLTGSGASSYSWDNGVSNGVSFTQSPGTMTYTVTGTDANGCQNTDMVDVTVNGLPSVFAGVDQSICVGDNVILYGDGANTYSWDNGVSDSIPFNPTITKTYHVTGTDANGCMNMDSVLVTVNSLPVVNGGSDQSVCDGGFITLSGSGADSYSWDHGVSDGFSFMPPATDLYVVTGYDLNGCSANDTVLVTVNTLPAVDAGTDQSVCEGTSVTLSGSGANSYSWDNGVSDGVSFTPAVGFVTYTVTGTDGNGCMNTDQVNVEIHQTPFIDAGSDQVVCSGADVTLAGSGGDSYIWDNGVTDNVIFNPTTTLTYTVTGTDVNGCSNVDDVVVTVNSLPVISGGVDQTVCENTSVVLSGSGGTTYLWDNGVFDSVSFIPTVSALYVVTGYDGNGCSANDTVLVTVNALPIVDAGADQTACENSDVILTATGADSFSWDNGVFNGTPFTVTATTTYTVTGTDLNGCQSTDQVTVTVNPLPSVNAGPDMSACENASFMLIGSGADSYSWDNGVTDGVFFTPPVGVTTYSVTGTDTNGCVSSDNLTISVFALPTINTAGALEICQEEEITLNAISSSSIILWYNQSSGGTPIQNGSDLQLSSLVSDTSLYVEAFENGCTSARIPVTITVNPKPVVSLSSTNSNCGASNGTADAVISSGTAPFTYYWSSGEQQVLSVSNLGTGSYYFNVEDSKGCKAIGVTEIIPSGISITPDITNPTCHGSTNGLIELNVSGISENLIYLWSTGHHTTNLSNVGAGTYEVTITGESGCVLTSTFTLTQPDQIMNAVNQQKPTCGDNDGQLSVDATVGGQAPYFYSWSNGQTGMQNNNLTYGSYILTTSDQAGCQIQNTYYLSETGAPLIKGYVTETGCGSPTGAIDLDITPGPGDSVASISWSNAATTEDISNLAPGNYVCFLNTSNNCTAVNAWTVSTAKPMTQEICIVSVDSVTTSNLVVWEKVQTSGISHYNIYRESNQIDEYQLIDTVQFSNLSVFNDVVASPMTRSWRYRISAVDICGVESDLSQPNKTLHLNIFDLGVGGVKITWDAYEGNAFSNYILWKYTEANGWENVATVSPSSLNYTDASAVFTESGLDYMVEIALDSACTATTWRAQDFNRSRSNKERGAFKAGEGTGHSHNEIVEFEQDNISLNVYPNPFGESINIELQGTEQLDLEIYNIQNQLVKSTRCKNGVNNLDLVELSKGIYYIKVNNKQESKIIRIVKN